MQFNFFSQNMVVSQLQILIVLIIFSSFLLNFIEFTTFLGIQLIIGIYFWGLMLKPVKNQFKKQFKHFLAFFGILFILVELAWIIQKTIPTTDENQLTYLFGLLLAIFAFAVFYRMIFAKKTIKAKIVMNEKNSAVIETNFDIISFTKAGKYIVETDKKYSPGTIVEVELKHALFKTKPWKIIR